jgi:hypothetical protein
VRAPLRRFGWPIRTIQKFNKPTDIRLLAEQWRFDVFAANISAR